MEKKSSTKSIREIFLKKPYRCSLDDREEIEKQIDQLLKKELIEESYSPFAAPVTLAFKRDEGKKSRLCIDFRDLNKINVPQPQPQPFPLIEDLMVKTINCKYFTTLDINSAFWSIPLRISDREKTGFVTQEGHYQWTCLPFGLKTSLAIFQRILTNIIRKHNLSNYVMNYIDDILVFSKTFDDDMDHLSKRNKEWTQNGGEIKPVAYFSKKLNESQKKKKTIFLECLAIKESLKFWQHWLIGNSFTIYKDHKPLENLNIKNRTDDELGDMTHYLSQYNFVIKYNPGINQIESKIRPFYTAPNLLDNIKLICRQCEVCIKNKTRLNRKYGLMSQLGPAEKPLQIMSIDTVGGFGGNRSSKKVSTLVNGSFHTLCLHFML
ncbi:unnamed protein product [Euphydryas editha]|uniref:Reverse transcriptase domain-containing protein n=1 Tax=Euphydryas editha TaxID=104508 RepID=A0AAU9UNG0_EUPED|nr:unnamed protein product [Euphydryas editha]